MTLLKNWKTQEGKGNAYKLIKDSKDNPEMILTCAVFKDGSFDTENWAAVSTEAFAEDERQQFIDEMVELFGEDSKKYYPISLWLKPERMDFYTFRVETFDSDGFPHQHYIHGIETRPVDGLPKFYLDKDYLNILREADHTKIEISDSIEMDYNKSVIKSFYMDEIEPVLVKYDRVQHYGGSEEGGWYYHTEEAKSILHGETPESIEDAINANDLDSHGEGEIFRLEFYFGQSENLTRQVYC